MSPADVVSWKQIVTRRLSVSDSEGRLALSCILARLIRVEDEKAALLEELEKATYANRLMVAK